MVFDAAASANTLPFLTVPGSADFLRESDNTRFRGVLRRQEIVDQRPGVLRQVGNWTLTTQSAVALADGEIVREGTRRFRVQYSEDDELGLVEYILSLAV